MWSEDGRGGRGALESAWEATHGAACQMSVPPSTVRHMSAEGQMPKRRKRDLAIMVGCRVSEQDEARIDRLLLQLRGIRRQSFVRELLLLGLEQAEALGPSAILRAPGGES